MVAIPINVWRERGTKVRLRRRNVFVIDEGVETGPPLLLLHGFPTASWDWSPIWEQLKATQRVIAFDFLGFGFSDKPNPHDYTILGQAALTEALVEHLGLTTFHVMAHDYGDTVAQELLARQNEGSGAGTWLSLMLLNGGLFPETHRPRLLQKLLLTSAGPLLTRLVNQRSFSRAFSQVWGPDTQPSQEELQAFWELIIHNDGNKIMNRLLRYIPERTLHRPRWVDALREAEIALGLINGSVDPVSGAHMVARYREIISKQHFITELPTIGHYPQVEAPDEVLKAYGEFRQGLE